MKIYKRVVFFSEEFYEIIKNAKDNFVKSLGNFLPEKTIDVQESYLIKCENVNIHHNGIAYICYIEMFAKNDKPFVFTINTINPINEFLEEKQKSNFIKKSNKNYKYN